jgi:D-cysteine desulfhydrase family pyridoxal phosphate-dependent enzyme
LQRVQLGRFPTPIHSFSVLDDEDVKISMFLKRDDLSSFDLSGNKVRKLEFLLAEALSAGHDCVATIGGIQSNHARSTAVASRQMGLDPYLILRTKEPSSDPGLVGNLLLDRLVGAKIYQVSPGTYAQLGQAKLLEVLRQQLIGEGRNPYIIPVGGSNPVGAFGYMEAVEEIRRQSLESNMHFDHIVFACGSGGTATGIALACRLSGLSSKVHAIGVCDSADYFYAHIEQVSRELGVDLASVGSARDWCTMYEGQGLGYARSSDDELRFIAAVCRKTGVLLDPVYSGKALYHFVTKVLRGPSASAAFRPGENVLFLHTGGVLGMFDKCEQLLPLLGDTVEKLRI